MNYLKPLVSLKPKVLEVWNQIQLPLLKHYPVPFGSRLSGNKFFQISNSIIWTKTKVKKSQQTGFCQSAFVLLLLSCIIMCRWPPGNNVAIVWWKSCETAFQFKKKTLFFRTRRVYTVHVFKGYLHLTRTFFPRRSLHVTSIIFELGNISMLDTNNTKRTTF